jgi:ribonuclease D
MNESSSSAQNKPERVGFEIVTETDELTQLCTIWAAQDTISLDTEFERIRTFYPRPALIQLGTADRIWLLDPLTILDFRAFAELLSRSTTTKILHSASEDLELLARLTGTLPVPLFDTQIAAGLLGYGFSMGYQRMVQTFCDINLDKHETRSNWLKRPLSDSQLRYAAYDVHYLPTIHRRLNDELIASGRETWLHEECDALVAKQQASDDFAKSYERIGHAWKLEPLELGVLRALSAWREHEIRSRDIPRAHLLKDDTLVELARRQPEQLAHLSPIEGLSKRECQRSGTTLLNIIAKVCALDAEQLPPTLPAPLNSKQFDPLLKKLKAVVSKTAERINTAPELLGHRRALAQLLRHCVVDEMPGLTTFFQGWRQEVIGESLRKALDR